MPKQSTAEEFIAMSKSDPQLSDRIMKIFSTHGSAAAKEILQLAREHGFSFSQSDLENSALSSAAKEMGLEAEPLKASQERFAAIEPPESACSRGCLSYTHNWHPDPIMR